VRPRALLAAAAVTLAATALPAAAGRAAPLRCSGDPRVQHRLNLTVEGQQTFGYYAVPKGRPRGLVAFAHGYGHTAESWRAHASRISAQLGVITVAMEYRGQTRTAPTKPGGLPGSRGWRVREGAADTNAAVAALLSACRVSGPVVLYGVSMGGNSSGLALASKPIRPGGSPMYDHWFAIEPAANVTETYLEARSLSVSNNKTAVNAVADIEAEMGGPIESKPDAYRAHTVMARIPEIVASGIRGVTIVHGVGDGLVPYNQGRELGQALKAQRMPVDFTTVLTRSPGTEPGTVIDGYVPVPHESPFAGHASETSTTHDVGRIGFEKLVAWFDGQYFCGEAVFDGTAQAAAGVRAC
jgi:acetyl esterase/lipase